MKKRKRPRLSVAQALEIIDDFVVNHWCYIDDFDRLFPPQVMWGHVTHGCFEEHYVQPNHDINTFRELLQEHSPRFVVLLDAIVAEQRMKQDAQ